METKILKAVFGGGTSTVTNKRTRTDYGQVLEIIGIDLPDTFECIFSNSNTSAGVGKKMIGSAQRVLIPDEYLKTGQTIYAWILLHDTEDDGRHMYSIRIPVADMPDTSREEPTPVEQSVISQAITALNSAVDTTTQKAQEATESADRAEQAAEGAEGYAERAESAQQAAESARDRATQAETSARTSAATATEKASEAISSAATASQSAIDAEQESERAKSFAESSAQSAEAARQFAINAGNKAYDASEYAQTASGYASNANASAQTASQKALEAAQSASSASQSKTDAETAKQASKTAQGLAESARDGAVSAKTGAESARDEAQEIVDGITGKVEQIDSNTDRIESLEDDRYKPYAVDSASGAIASFVDGADNIPLKSCIVRVEPVQDLHGYDSPWPAGGGKNLLDPTYRVNEPSNVRFYYNSDGLLLKANTAYTLSTSIAVAGLYINSISNDKLAVNYGKTSLTYTPTEDVLVKINAYFSEDYPAPSGGTENVLVQLEVGSSATSYAPYSNICPITGWTGAKVTRTGVNVWDEEWEVGAYSGTTGEKITNTTNMRCKNAIPVKPNTAYYCKSPYAMYVFEHSADGTYLGYTTILNNTMTTKANSCYMRFYLLAGYGTTYNNDISINYPSTVTSYEPYQGQTYPITFPSEAGTVYGGYIDPINGELVVDRGKTVLNGTEAWDNRTGYSGIYSLTVQNIKPTASSTIASDVISDYLPSVSQIAIIHGTIGVAIFNWGSQIVVRLPDVTTLADFKTYLSEHPLTVVYPLATPITIQLDAHTLNSLYGQNNIWSDTGDVSVEYRADTKLYIEKLTQPEEDDMIADSVINSGQFFMVGNSLYRALANIASGATITVGTNAQRVSLSDALNLVNA